MEKSMLGGTDGAASRLLAFEWDEGGSNAGTTLSA
jgi:hypothetical protein